LDLVIGRSRRSPFYRRPWLRRAYWSFQSRFWDDRLRPGVLEERVRLLEGWLAGHGRPGGGRILDVGCGTAAHASLLAEAGYAVVGIDFAWAMLERARANTRNARAVAFARADINDGLPIAGGSFDGSLCLSVLHWVGDAPRFLAEVHRVLRPGGLVALGMVRCGADQGTPPSVTRFVFGMLKLLPGWRDRSQTCTTGELVSTLEGAGLDVLEERVVSAQLWLLARKRIGAPAPGTPSGRPA
jgi:SAM-dependent methyltransferase